MLVSIIILYHNRYDGLSSLLSYLLSNCSSAYEIIIVDNNSDIDAQSCVSNDIVKYIRLNDNYGTASRNIGFDVATGDIVICLDDDIIGLTDNDLDLLYHLFADTDIAAVCFKIINSSDHTISNWSHHYDQEKYSDIYFETNRISEGAVAFRRFVLNKVGGYYDKFFISHEGPDLACRIMSFGKKIIFCPDITVEHHHSIIGRPSWRRYYYDTRNMLWFCVRNYPLTFSFKRLLLGIVPMLIYSIRDGYLYYWLKGIYDAFRYLPEIYKGRQVISNDVIERIKVIESHRPSFFSLSRKRLFKRSVSI